MITSENVSPNPRSWSIRALIWSFGVGENGGRVGGGIDGGVVGGGMVGGGGGEVGGGMVGGGGVVNGGSVGGGGNVGGGMVGGGCVDGEVWGGCVGGGWVGGGGKVGNGGKVGIVNPGIVGGVWAPAEVMSRLALPTAAAAKATIRRCHVRIADLPVVNRPAGFPTLDRNLAASHPGPRTIEA